MCAPLVTRHTSLRYSSFCDTRVTWMLSACRNPFSVNCLCHARIVLSVGGVLCVLCTKCILHSNHRLTRVILQHTKVFSPGAAIFSLQTLASPTGRNVNCDEKQLTGEKFSSCFFNLHRFRKYVSYGFPIINFCNPGVHYETPCR